MTITITFSFTFSRAIYHARGPDICILTQHIYNVPRVSNKYFGERKVSGVNSLLVNHINVLLKSDVMYRSRLKWRVFHKFSTLKYYVISQ